MSSFMTVDPAEVYFTHSKIRPIFSGCGKRIQETIEEITVSGITTIDDIPSITVLRSDAGYLFSLNNRRLFLFKYLRANGHLLRTNPPNTIRVRVKEPLEREKRKYTIDQCSLTATLFHEKAVQCDDDDESSAAGVVSTETEAAMSTTIAQPPKVLKAPRSESTKLPDQIMSQMKSLEKLARKPRRAELDSRLNELEDEGIISAVQRIQLEALLSIR